MKNIITAFKKENKDSAEFTLIRNKFWATSLFVLMGLIFIVSNFFEADSLALSYIKASAEAGMVGALADWFAVVALFKHPLGLPIPHTAIIKANKDRLGKSLGNFVRDNFLTPENIMKEFNVINIGEEGVKLLKKNKEKILSKIYEVIPKILSFIDRKEIKEIIIETMLAVNFGKFSGDLIEIFTKDNKHQVFLDFTLTEVKKLLVRNKEEIIDLIGEETGKYIPKFVDKMIANKIINALNNNFDNVLDDSEHKFRKYFDEFIKEKTKNLKHDKAVQETLDTKLKSMISNKILGDYIESSWDSIRRSIEEDLKDSNSNICRGINSGFSSLIDYLESDKKMLENIDHGIKEVIKDLLMEEKDKISKIISDKVENASADDVSDMIEKYIGKDLQYIRMNGTIVGSLVGLILFTISRFL
jgi:uncharacterized membrane-anchored protein YjiN (DUF445 family)